jgi:hypothetical protein
VNKKIEILSLNNDDEVVFLRYLNERYFKFSIGDRFMYIPSSNELLINLMKDTINFNEIGFVNHSLVLLNGKLNIIKYGNKIKTILSEHEGRLLDINFPNILVVKIDDIQGGLKSFDRSYVTLSNFNMIHFYSDEFFYIQNIVFNLMNKYDEFIRKSLLMNNFDLFLAEINKKGDDRDRINDILNSDKYAPLIRQYKLKSLGFDE